MNAQQTKTSRLKSIFTCDNEAFIIFQSFSKEAGDNEFRVDDEPDFFLDQSTSSYSSAYKHIRKIHLVKKKARKD